MQAARKEIDIERESQVRQTGMRTLGLGHLLDAPCGSANGLAAKRLSLWCAV